MALRKCKRCGNENAMDAKACLKCGMSLKMGMGKKILIGFGAVVGSLMGLAVLGAAVVTKRLPAAATTSTPTATLPAAQEAPFIAALARLTTNPKAIKPTKVTPPSKNEPDYEYDYGDPTGMTIRDVQLYVRKSNPTEWMLLFDASGARAEDFAPAGGLTKIPKEFPTGDLVYEITSGPLKGTVLDRTKDGTLSSVKTIVYAVNDGALGFEWFCDNGRVPGVPPFDKASFVTDSCQAMVKKQLLAPAEAEFPGILDHIRVETTKKCGRAWHAWVDSPNAFGVKIRRTFLCTYDATKNLVNLTVDPL